MGVDQQQSTNNGATRDGVVQLQQSGIVEQGDTVERRLKRDIWSEAIGGAFEFFDMLFSGKHRMARQNTTEISPTTEIPLAERYRNGSAHLGAEQGDLGMVKYFVENGADINAQNSGDDMPLHLAAEGGHLDVVKYLIANGADVNTKGMWAATPVLLAAKNGYCDVVKYLVANGADINLRGLRGETPLHAAAGNGYLDVVGYLIEEKGADLNAKDELDETPLHSAAGGGHLDVVKYLIEEKGADLNARSLYDCTPLHNAASWGNLDVVRYLVKKGADVNAMSKYDEGTPLHSASVYRGHLDVVKYLVEKGADVNAKDSLKARTPLHLAAYSDNLDLVKFFIEKGADINAKNNDGDTPLDLAKSRENLEVVKFLSPHQHGNRDHRDVSNNSRMNNSVVNWVRGFILPTEPPALLTSEEHNNHASAVAPEINATLVNGTIVLGILTAGLFSKTQHRQPIDILSSKQSVMQGKLGEVERTIRKWGRKIVLTLVLMKYCFAVRKLGYRNDFLTGYIANLGRICPFIIPLLVSEIYAKIPQINPSCCKSKI